MPVYKSTLQLELLAYVIITMAEVFVSITCWSSLYTSTEKDEIFYYVSILIVVSLGNILLVWSTFSFKMMMVVANWQVLIITCSLRGVCWLRCFLCALCYGL